MVGWLVGNLTLAALAKGRFSAKKGTFIAALLFYKANLK